jgi:hypothetical protein
MQLIERNAHTRHFEKSSADHLQDRILYKRLLPLPAIGLLIGLGPTVVSALAQACLIAIQIFLEAGRVAVLAFQIFGHILGQ